MANLGVIAGIIFLAIEVNQNSQMMKAQTRSDISKSITELSFGYANSPYIAEFSGFDSSNTERISQIRVNIFTSSLLRTWENIHYQYRNGLYEVSEFSKEKEAWRTNINLPVRKEIFCQTRRLYSDEFVAELSLLLNEPCSGE